MNDAAKLLGVVSACLAGLGVAPQAAAQSVPGPGDTGYTCCNFHPDGDWISDANWSSLPRIPAGSPASILEFGDYRVRVEIGGRRMWLGLDYGRKQPLRSWASLMIVEKDPKETIDTWPDPVREAVNAGKVALGMSKEQVIAAVGYPPAHATPSMDAAQWKYWYDTHGTYLVVWDESGNVKDVVTTPQIRAAILLDTGGEPTAASAMGAPAKLGDLEGLLPGTGGAKK